jgi:hypothetical protein
MRPGSSTCCQYDKGCPGVEVGRYVDSSHSQIIAVTDKWGQVDVLVNNAGAVEGIQWVRVGLEGWKGGWRGVGFKGCGRLQECGVWRVC